MSALAMNKTILDQESAKGNAVYFLVPNFMSTGVL